MATKPLQLTIKSIDQLALFAKVFSTIVSPPMIIGLNGDMGSGKTTFVRLFGEVIESTDWINSPTYSIIQRYKAKNYTILHVDLYRTNGEIDIDLLDIDSQINNQTVAFIEWLEKTTLIRPNIELNFSIKDDNQRIIDITSSNQQWLDTLNNTNTY